MQSVVLCTGIEKIFFDGSLLKNALQIPLKLCLFMGKLPRLRCLQVLFSQHDYNNTIISSLPNLKNLASLCMINLSRENNSLLAEVLNRTSIVELDGHFMQHPDLQKAIEINIRRVSCAALIVACRRCELFLPTELWQMLAGEFLLLPMRDEPVALAAPVAPVAPVALAAPAEPVALAAPAAPAVNEAEKKNYGLEIFKKHPLIITALMLLGVGILPIVFLIFISYIDNRFDLNLFNNNSIVPRQ